MNINVSLYRRFSATTFCYLSLSATAAIMAVRGFTLGLAMLTFSATFTCAQTQDKAENVGTANAVSEAQKLTIAPMGCSTFLFSNDLPDFNYTAKMGLAALPPGCDAKLIRVLKQYTLGSCPETRANNYKVPSLKISNNCNDPILIASNQTCANAFLIAPPSAFAPKGISSGSTIDSGNVCWLSPKLFYFIENRCEAPITATIKVTRDVFKGDCKNENDSDDGGDDAGGAAIGTTASGKSSKSGGLSKGAKAGIAIGVIVGVILIVVAVWFFCCQLGKA